VAYRLSDRLNQDRPPSLFEVLDLGKIATVFIVCGFISLCTAWVFSWETAQVFNHTVTGPAAAPVPFRLEGPRPSEIVKDVTTLGPIFVAKNREVFAIRLTAPLPANTWAFLEGEVLDAEKEYLFSFGKEIWHETGRDSDGAWQESDLDYTMKVTFPQPGVYYLKLKANGSHDVTAIAVTISKRRGSSLPHLIFGISTLLIGLVLNELRNKTLATLTALTALALRESR
jgi:hypothetical protein